MSKNAAKVGDIGTDHDGFHPTAITAGSPDVFIDGIPAARVGDPLAPHDKPNHPPHPRKIASGSSTVLVNGKPLAITGGAVDCGGVIIGSGTVIVGDITPPEVSSLLQNLLFDRKITFSSDVGFLLEDSAGKILASGRSGSAYTGLIKNSGTITAFIGGENE
nr:MULTISPECIES: type VI secretion system PAAR protein [Aeromonas]